MSDYRYEAWRNLLLILASILVADAVSRTNDVQKAVASLGEFDKALPFLDEFSGLVALFVVIFVFKSAHGILVTLFRPDYVLAVSGSRAATVMSCLLSTSVI